MKKFACGFIAVIMLMTVLFSASVCSAGAVSYPNNINTHSKSVLLVSMDNGQTVYEKDADKQMYPASTTKIMTYIIAYENIEDIDNTRIEIKKSVLDKLNGTGSSTAYLDDHIGQKVKVIDLLYSLMVPSGNDAALVLADYVGGGDIKVFVNKMNAKAQELGCKNTHFANADGLHDKNHYTTARDLLLITNYALKLPRFKKISNTVSYTCEGDEDPIRTTNLLIDGNSEYYYQYAEGIKTGTTDEAGRCLVTMGSADGQSYMLILLGAPYKMGDQEEYYTFIDAKALFRWCLTELELTTLKTTETPICETGVKSSMDRSKVTLVPEKNLITIIPKELEPDEVIIEPDVPEQLKAPLKKDDVVGTASVYFIDPNSGEKQLVETVNLLPADDVSYSGLKAFGETMGEIFKSYWFLIIIGIIVLVIVIYIIAARVHRAKKRRNREVKRYRNF